MTDFLADALQRHPEAIAADDGRRRWSWSDVDRQASAWQERLAEAGAGAGRRVALLLPPTLDTVAALHGAFRTGALVAPLHPALTPPERAAALQAIDATVVVDKGGMHRRVTTPPATPPHPDAVAVLWTSGTSGHPRGVLLTEAGLRASTEGARQRLALAATDCWHASTCPAASRSTTSRAPSTRGT